MDKKANYEKIIKNAKKVKKILEKSKMRPEILQSMNFLKKQKDNLIHGETVMMICF